MQDQMLSAARAAAAAGGSTGAKSKTAGVLPGVGVGADPGAAASRAVEPGLQQKLPAQVPQMPRKPCVSCVNNSESLCTHSTRCDIADAAALCHS